MVAWYVELYQVSVHTNKRFIGRTNTRPTLDEFIGSALADIFAGKEIKLTDNQLKKMKNPEVAFSEDLSITQIVEKGRENGFSDASIREVLKGRGFKVADINEAMTYQVDLFNELPVEFQE